MALLVTVDDGEVHRQDLVLDQGSMNHILPARLPARLFRSVRVDYDIWFIYQSHLFVGCRIRI